MTVLRSLACLVDRRLVLFVLWWTERWALDVLRSHGVRIVRPERTSSDRLTFYVPRPYASLAAGVLVEAGLPLRRGDPGYFYTWREAER